MCRERERERERREREREEREKRSGRASNLELFRIIAMLLIVAHHYVVNSGLTASGGPVYANPFSGKSVFLLFFGAWGKPGINCFMMITGYFMCKSHITVRKYVKLVLEVIFYHIVLYIALLSGGYESLSVERILKVLLPITTLKTNFTGCFLAFYLCIPFLSILVNHLNEKQHLRLILLFAFLYMFLGGIPLFTVSMNYVSWFSMIFFVASYIRLYPKHIFDNVVLWRRMTIISVLLVWASIIGMAILSNLIFGKSKSLYFFVRDVNHILPVLVGITSFLYFKNLKIRYSRVINTIAASTFGVLCLHANSDAMRQWLWKDFLNCVGAYSSPLLPLHTILSVIGIFCVGTILDQIRIRLFEKPFFDIVWEKYWPSVEERLGLLEHKICLKIGIKD